MLLKYFYDEHLAQASYLVGCARTGEALVVDPGRDIQPYLDLAAKEGLRITHVTETHIHADFVSGSRELAARTGAMIYLSDMGGPDWKYAYASQPNVILVRDGDSWMVGNIKVEVIHTPGHTPEHIVFMITDTAGANKPMGIFSGDFIFVGDVGRPDLLENAAGVKGTKEPGARDQFKSVQRFRNLPDYLQIWPGHGAGSACGKALGAIPSTTLGYEKLFNPAFQIENENEFVAWLLDGQPEAPRYFAQMKRVNKEGPTLLKDLEAPKRLDRAELDRLIADNAQIYDLRNRRAYTKAHIPGTISIPSTSANYSTYVGWFVDFARPTYVIVSEESRVRSVEEALRAIGVDQIAGYFLPDVLDQNTQQLPTLNAQELSERVKHNGLTIIDVRGQSEYQEQHIIGARHIPLGYLPMHVDELSKDKPIILQCASGYRSQIATSLLRAKGFSNVVNLDADTEVWSKLLPTEKGR